MIDRIALSVRGAAQAGKASALIHPFTPSPFLAQRALLQPCLARFAHSPAASARPSPFPGVKPQPAKSRSVSRHGVTLLSPWSWRILSSSPDTVVEERLAFARPADLDSRIPITVTGVWWLFVITGLLVTSDGMPNVTEEEQKRLDAETKEKLESLPFVYRTAATLGSVASPVVLIGTALLMTAFSLFTFRIPTRIVVHRVTSLKNPEQVKTSLQLTTAGHDGVFGMIPPRKLNINDCELYMASASRIRLRVRRPDNTPNRYNFDRIPYSLDMRPYDLSKVKPGQVIDVVQSVNRLEYVLGPMVKKY